MLGSALQTLPVGGKNSVAEFPLDQPAYLNSLRHLGEPRVLPRTGLAVLRRPIPGSPWADLLAPVPYSHSLAGVEPEALHADLMDQDAVAFVGSLCPASPNRPEERWSRAGFILKQMRPHYVYCGDRSGVAHGPRTRRHIRVGLRDWQVRWEPLAACHRQVAAAFALLARRKKMITLSRHPAEHFRTLAEVPGVASISAYDAEGWGASLVVAKFGDDVHCLTVTGEPRAYRQDAFYAIFAFATARCANGRLFLGGAPSAQGDEGVARFKERFANSRGDIRLVQATLCPQRCDELVRRHGRANWFPPYRDPFTESTAHAYLASGN